MESLHFLYSNMIFQPDHEKLPLKQFNFKHLRHSSAYKLRNPFLAIKFVKMLRKGSQTLLSLCGWEMSIKLAISRNELSDPSVSFSLLP